MVEVGASIERDNDVQAARSRRHQIRNQIVDRLQYFPQGASDSNHRLECPPGRIQVEDQSVRVIQSIDTTQPHVRRDAPLIGEGDQGRGLLSTTTCVTEPPAFFTVTVLIHSGKYSGTSF